MIQECKNPIEEDMEEEFTMRLSDVPYEEAKELVGQLREVDIKEVYGRK